MLKSLNGFFKKGFSKKRVIGVVIFVVAVISAIIAIVMNQLNERGLKERKVLGSGELARAMSYDQFVDGDDAVDGTDNVKFSAFFLRDINGDGNAEKIKGTCKQIGSEDTLYMEVNVQNGGVLKDGKIQINGKNFLLSTSAPKDNELKDNYIGNDIKKLEFNDLSSGTQKLVTGIVRSGDYDYPSTVASAIDEDIDKLSVKDNDVVFTGTYVDSNGNEIQINKKITFQTDWYGDVHAILSTVDSTKYDIKSRQNEEEGTITLEASIYSGETLYQLNPKKNYVEGTIPQLNGYDPISVTMNSSAGSFNYDDATRKFVIINESKIDEKTHKLDRISRTNTYTLKVVYPLQAYKSLGTPNVVLRIPVMTYYEGYNNSNPEFTNPCESNIVQYNLNFYFRDEIKYSNQFNISIGEVEVSPETRNIVRKTKPLNIYNGISSEESDDNYFVSWYVDKGEGESNEGLIFKESENQNGIVSDYFVNSDSSTFSMENITTNVGIAFEREEKFLGDDGFIKVYDDETDELLVTFTKDDWGKYTKVSPYKFDVPVKHIRVETSETQDREYFCIYSQKQLDDEYITNHFSKEQFDNIKYIESSFSVYAGTKLLDTLTDLAIYEAPFSVAKLNLSNDSISTQTTEKNEILTIDAYAHQSTNEVAWRDGSFLVKIPEDIIDVKINTVKSDNRDVDVTSYEYIEKDNGKFIKINTKNLSDTAQVFEVKIDADLTANPSITDTTENFELWASNEENSNYFYGAEDIYDVNDNLNTSEIVHKSTTAVKIIAPSTLLANQMASEFDENGTQITAPQIADLEPKLDSSENTIKIGARIKNNYSASVSDVMVLGKIPFENNTAVVSGENLSSEFTTKMTNAGIEIPEALQGKVAVYYSESENPDKDLSKESNGWKTAENVSDWDAVKTFLINLQEVKLEAGDEYTFYYTVKVPNGVEYNKKAFSQCGVYFALNTPDGKFKTQVEPAKLGIRVAKKYNLELQKYQIGRTNLVAGATYKIIGEATGNEDEKISTSVTNSEGKLTFTNLYVDRVYSIEEIKAPENYELNNDVIKVIGRVQEDGSVKVDKIQGTTKGDIEADQEGKSIVKVEDEANVKLKITTLEKGTLTPISAVRYKLTGGNLPQNGKCASTNVYGELTLNGLIVGEEYTLEEIKTIGYYVEGSIKFKVLNNDGNYTVDILDGTVKESEITEDDNIPMALIKVENEKVPTYNLEISKIRRITSTAVTSDELKAKAEEALSSTDTVYLSGAKFKLYKDSKELGKYVSDENGKITINDLYQYIDGKSEDAIYTLKETVSPDGYTKAKDIEFKVDGSTGELKFVNTDGSAESYTVENGTVKLLVEDSPVFKLIKKDAETKEPIANAKFAIYNIDDDIPVVAKNSKGEILGTKETINGKEYYTVTTDNNGEIMADLPEGLYKAVEVQAPDKYDISDSTYYFGIGTSKSVEDTEKMEQVVSAKRIGGEYNDNVADIVKTKDGGYVAVGSFASANVDFGNGVSLVNHSEDQADGFIVKYNSNDEAEWAKCVGARFNEDLYKVIECNDGGYLTVGVYREEIDLGNGIILEDNDFADAMIIKFNSMGEAQWAQRIAGTYEDYITSVTECSDGGFFVGGHFQSTNIELGNGINLVQKGSKDGFIVKYNSIGEPEWAQVVGGDWADEINSVAGTRDGGCVAVGDFKSKSINFENGTTLTNKKTNETMDGMVLKYSSSGDLEWVKQIAGDRDDCLNLVIESSNGGYLVGGHYNSYDLDLGDGKGRPMASGEDSVVLKYNTSGEVEWSSLITGTNDEYISSITECNDDGYIFGASVSSSSIHYSNSEEDEEIKFDSSSEYGTVIKATKDGMFEWAKGIGQNGAVGINSITETNDGKYIIGGVFYDSDLDLSKNIKLNNQGKSDGMIIKMGKEETINPKIVQAIRMGEENNEKVSSMVATRDGGYIVCGMLQSSSVDLKDDISLSNIGYANGMIVKYNADGEVQWGHSIGGKFYDSLVSVTQCIDGGYIAGGSFTSESIEFGNGIKVSNTNTNGYEDALIVKYSEDGDVEWAKSFGGRSSDYITCIKATKDGGYFVSGYFKSDVIEIENGIKITNKGDNDGFVIKYNAKGKVEWAKQIGGTKEDIINSVTETNDGGCLIGGSFESANIVLEGTNVLKNQSEENYENGMLIKYNSDGTLEWFKEFGGKYSEIVSVTACSDGKYLIGGNFRGDEIDLGNGITLAGGTLSRGMIIKYSSEGNVEWAKVMGYGYSETNISSMIECSDNGYLVSGSFENRCLQLENGVNIVEKTEGEQSFIIKYDKNGKQQWVKSVGGTLSNSLTVDRIISAVIEIDDGVYIAGGWFGKGFSPMSLDGEESKEEFRLNVDEKILPNRGKFDAMILKIVTQMNSREVQELEVENKRKEFKITTDVNEIDNIKGGFISGEDDDAYEVVKYGDSSIKEIKMIPDENYEIIEITVNGENCEYTSNSDGSYTMPAFTNVTEDKHVVVTYSLKDNKIIINKVDKDTKEKLEGAKFSIEQVEERPEPAMSDVIGKFVVDSKYYTEVNPGEEVDGRLGNITKNGTEYFVQNDDGTYVPTNTLEYKEANGESTDDIKVNAYSYIPIDLTGLTGKYTVVINAEMDTYSINTGYARITNSTTEPGNYSGTGRVMDIEGKQSAKDYISPVLDGGKVYYLHFRYARFSSGENGQDSFVINSVKLHKATVNTVRYGFTNINGKYESTNARRDSTESSGYIPIDLTNCTGLYDLIINADGSGASGDYGYAIINNVTTKANYNDTTGKIISKDGVFEAKDYTTTLQGGKMYYLHIGYRKNGIRSAADDRFTINSIKISLNDSNIYHTIVETNSKGQALTQLPFGNYTITEIKAPEGYCLNETPTTIEFSKDAVHEFTIENEKKAKLTVHHYIKGTTIKVADDEYYEAKVGEKYTTLPKMDLDKYELEKDSNGNYILPENLSGTYNQSPTEVTYYYVEKKIPLTVHYYIEGTTTPVPMKDGGVAEDKKESGAFGEEYTTDSISNDDLNDEYELVEVPSNASGEYTWKEVVVTYYYRRISREVTLIKYQKDGVTPLEGAKFTIDGNEYVTDSDGKIKVNLEAGTYEITEVEPPEGYKLPDNPTTEITITRDIPAIINIINEKKTGTVTVHHYIEGTTTSVPLKNGDVAKDEVKTGDIGEWYATKPVDDLSEGYELVSEPGNGSGTYVDGNIEVIYYYKSIPTSVIVHHYLEGTTTKLADDVTIEGLAGDNYTTSAATVDNKYEVVEIPANANGKMTREQIVVIYYYRVKDAVVNVRYLEKGTDKVLADPDRIDGKVDEDYQTEAKEIDGYQLVEHTGNEKGKFEVEPLTITYYYLYKTKATVQYIDKITGQILEQSTTEGLEGDDFVTESKDFENYVLVEEPAEKTVKMTKEEQILKYYYIHISGGVIEKHIDVISGKILANKTYEGNEGDAYDIPSRTFDGYDLVEDRLPSNAKGTMKVEPVEVIYYYIYKSKVTSEYIDKTTGEKLTDDVVQNGHEGDKYTTERKNFDDYKLIEVPANADGSMTKEDITVTYYYVHTSGGVIVNHIDIKTGKQLLDETKEEGYEGDPYETHEENIPEYDLVKEKYPENAVGKMTIEPTRVTYYYIKKTEVNVKYVDKVTGEKIENSINIPGHEGDDYITEPKDIPGYDLIEEPENKDGTMTADPIDVIYYYKRPAKVIVNYYDIDTKEKIADEIEITGHQNDDYTTEQKDIKYYEIAKVPENKEGKMIVTVTKDENGKEIVDDTTYVNYYYRKLVFNLRVDKTIASVIVNGQETPINGSLGKVEVHRKNISNANVKVVYKIKVTNDSELTGKANVVENIPSGMTMLSENNPDWTIKETTASLETDEIKPGESREYQVVLGWQNGDNNVGTKTNMVSITTENEAGFNEKNVLDNESKADLIVAVGTGEVPYVAIAGSALIIMIAMTAGVYVIRKRK